jgi:hypothetical protein
LADDLLAIGVPDEQAQRISVLGCLGFARDARALAERTGEPAADVVLRYAHLVQQHKVAAAATAGLAALRSEETAVRQIDALSTIRRDLLLRVALDGPPGGGEWRKKAMESMLRMPGPVTAALRPEITASLAGVQSDLAQQLQIPPTPRRPAAPTDRPAPVPGRRREQGSLMKRDNKATS